MTIAPPAAPAQAHATLRAPERDAQARTDVPSARPTSIPDYDCASLAMGTLPFGSQGNIPIDLAVPARVPGVDTSSLSHATAFVLMHIDGVSTIQMIASHAQLALSDVISEFLELIALGIVVIAHRSTDEAAPPASGVFERFVLPEDDDYER